MENTTKGEHLEEWCTSSTLARRRGGWWGSLTKTKPSSGSLSSADSPVVVEEPVLTRFYSVLWENVVLQERRLLGSAKCSAAAAATAVDASVVKSVGDGVVVAVIEADSNSPDRPPSKLLGHKLRCKPVQLIDPESSSSTVQEGVKSPSSCEDRCRQTGFYPNMSKAKAQFSRVRSSADEAC